MVYPLYVLLFCGMTYDTSYFLFYVVLINKHLVAICHGATTYPVGEIVELTTDLGVIKHHD